MNKKRFDWEALGEFLASMSIWGTFLVIWILTTLMKDFFI